MAQIEMKVIPVQSIIFGERFRKDYGDLKQLVLSFKEEGIIQPLAVKDMGDGNYTLLAGGRRFTAALMAELPSVPCRIYGTDLNDLQMRSIELMENHIRKDLDWVEAAKLREAIHNLQVEIHGEKVSTAPDAPGHSLRDTANMLGLSVGQASDDLKLAKALTMFPQLAEAKNKSDAHKKLNQLQEGLIREELAKRLASKVANTPMDKIHASLCQRYIVGDFFETVKKIPDRSIDFCEVDPPYSIDLTSIKDNYDSNFKEGDYNEVQAVEYIQFMDKVIKECYRVMVENSWMVLWFAPQPWLEDMYQLLVKNGFATTRLNGIWYKGQTGQCLQPDMYMASCYENFFYARKGNPSIIRQGRANVFHYRGVPTSVKSHPTERPIEMIQDVIQTFCWENSRILVPFAGSGNTLLAAENLGMTAIGCDLTQGYKDSFVVRVHDKTPPNYKSYKEDK
jgi:ParB/RepB/Spo0J family partition protein